MSGVDVANESLAALHNGTASKNLAGGRCPGVDTNPATLTVVPVMYGLIFVAGLVGNAMVVAVVLKYLKLRNVANVYIVNLATADLVFVTTLPLWAASVARGYDWPFGGFLCRVSATVVSVNMYASILLLACMSVDRYLAIVRPLQSRGGRTRRRARAACVAVWVTAALLSVPVAVFRVTFVHRGRTVCALRYPSARTWFLAMNVTRNVAGFLVPFLVIVTCYCLIGRTLLRRGGDVVRRDKVLPAVLAVVLAFLLCWLPYHVLTLLDTLVRLRVLRGCGITVAVDGAMPIAVVVAYTNSCLNPLLYSFVGKGFRQGFGRLLRLSAYVPPPLASSFTRSSSLRSRVVEMENIR
ncbi:type-1 angiotensin II receptor A-like [Petromyzon marinus]|uniref:Type-1 angiotensin II receptor n=1 Tax=Petromyzon marinus TaxID=7757 RepID=A0AAJ7XAZ9_PETMA|nr:type-1 angiotensin II receptor A-like [Petromyzon marinus]